MRDYGKVSPLFWTGNTGRRIRKRGQSTQLAALYLMTGPNANMLGVYHMPVVTLAHAIGSPFEGALEALRSLSEEAFCTYDEESEWVWVHEMARYQVADYLKEDDKRVIGIGKDWLALPDLPFLAAFYERYREAFHLPERGGSVSPFEAPSKPLPRGFTEATKPLRSQEQEQEQEQEEEKARLNGSRVPSESIERVFAHWQRTFGHSKAKLTAERRKLIAKAMKDYDEPTLLEAISGYKKSPYHMGDNEHRTVYDTIELILRDAKHIDSGVRYSRQTAAQNGARNWKPEQIV